MASMESVYLGLEKVLAVFEGLPLPAPICLGLLVFVAIYLLSVAYSMLPVKTVFDSSGIPIKVQLPLVARQQLTHNTIKLVFGLPYNHALGLPCGKHVAISTKHRGKMVARPYTPTSDGYRRLNEMEMVIKIYNPNPPRFPDGGVMSQILDELNLGDNITVKGPLGKIHYAGHGIFKIGLGPRAKPVETNHIGLIAGGTGITPIMSIIQQVNHTDGDNTHLYVLFANKTVDDILLRDELEEYAMLARKRGKNLKIHYTVDFVNEGTEWKHSNGFVDQKMLAKYMPIPGNNPVICFCGPPAMWKYAVAPNLAKLGFDKNRVFGFGTETHEAWDELH